MSGILIGNLTLVFRKLVHQLSGTRKLIDARIQAEDVNLLSKNHIGNFSMLERIY